jgi:hypothetical protein
MVLHNIATDCNDEFDYNADANDDPPPLTPPGQLENGMAVRDRFCQMHTFR